MVITANGLLLGFNLTYALSGLLLDSGTEEELTYGVFQVKLAYIFIGYYVSVSIPYLLARNTYSREKFSTLFSGLFGIYSGFLLSQGLGSRSVLFTGILFLACVFASTLVIESILIPVLYTLRTALPDKEWLTIETDRHYSRQAMVSLFNRATLANDEFRVVLALSVFWPPFIVLLVYLWSIIRS